MANLNNVAPVVFAPGATVANGFADLTGQFSNLVATVDTLTAAVAKLSTCSGGEFSAAFAAVTDAVNNVNGARVGFVAAWNSAAAIGIGASRRPPAPACAVVQPQSGTLIQGHGPWVAGILFTVIPRTALAAVADNGEKWFAITRGKYVGLTKNSAISLNAVTGVSTGLSEKFSSQADALNHFNAALVTGAVAVIV
ncbi:hypothetical protein B0H13DRAFT_2338753 [Mycena leptocephala]|nr:hypothetical protein B0H13DRAFT_2338753 [Mycena leptocephala]